MILNSHKKKKVSNKYFKIILSKQGKKKGNEPDTIVWFLPRGPAYLIRMKFDKGGGKKGARVDSNSINGSVERNLKCYHTPLKK